MSYIKQGKAFSVAEAMIALLIGSIALGMAAPMITKQVKVQNFSDAQFRISRDYMVPRGAVMFFNLESCPDKWSEVPSSWANSFLMIKNTDDSSRELASFEADSIPNITGIANVGHHTDNKTPETGTDGNAFYFGGGNKYKGPDAVDGNNQLLYFDASRVAEVYGRLNHGDLRPKNVALIACQKD